MNEQTDVNRLLERLGAVENRLTAHAREPAPSGLTDPDPDADERWEAGQVWAHLAEFPAYWLGQLELLIEHGRGGVPQPIPFGRTKADPARIAAIEAERQTSPTELLRRVVGQLASVRELAASLSASDWDIRGEHPTRGEMTVSGAFAEFLVKHLEEHAAQLDGLANQGEQADQGDQAARDS
jgi:hypothetical protein